MGQQNPQPQPTPPDDPIYQSDWYQAMKPYHQGEGDDPAFWDYVV